MHRDHQHWYSHRLNRDMGVTIYGNYGAPILAFPTSCGDESEMEGQGMIRTLSPYIEQGRIRLFCINSVNSDSFQNKGAHPFHRSWMQAQYDDYVANEVFPFIDSQCQTPGIGIATLGASLGAYHAANTLFKHPDHVKRCYALSGIYDMRDSMDGMYDDNFYFNNPVDYVANQSDPWYLHQYASCDIRLVTGCGPWENSGPTYRMSEVLNSRGIAHHLDDWGPRGRARMALLASPDVGIRRRTLLRTVRLAFQHGKESHRRLRVPIHPLPAPGQANVRPLLSLRRLSATDGQRVRAQRDHRDSRDQAAPRQAGTGAGAA